MTTFADQVHDSINQTGSFLVAGCDPVIEKFPAFILDGAEATTTTDAQFIERALDLFCELFLSAVAGKVAAIKPNIAFFEQYGLPGVSAFARLCTEIRAAGIPLITDAKRGDIGSTAAAYSAAFLGKTAVRGRLVESFPADALTINPFLGFDTLEPFLNDCKAFGKGVFVLVQTSNPGAASIQGLAAEGRPVREHIAQWLADHADELAGESGWSGLGAVVGASYPTEAKRLRQLMPRNLFLIPGLGAQGAAAKDSVAGFGVRDGAPGGALINVSRGLLEGAAHSAQDFVTTIGDNVARFNQQINRAIN